MTVLSLLDDMVVALTTAGIPFMLTGSFAAAVHGAGRATMDIDLVIDPTAASLAQFVSAIFRRPMRLRCTAALSTLNVSRLRSHSTSISR